MKNLLVTGGAGFIGANFIINALERLDGVNIINLDKLSYAGDPQRLASVQDNPAYTFLKADICDIKAVDEAFSAGGGIDAVVHFAAESHVDRSIEDAMPFEATNVRGTLVLLDAARRRGVQRFVHVSTDEVYGELGESGQFIETMPLEPNSPYSASKAAGDLFVKAYQHTYGLSVTTVRPSNNYGPWQYPEKLIPVIIKNALDDRPVPVYAQGLNVREWLYVEDCASGVLDVLARGRSGEAYNIGSSQERRNIEVVKAVLALLGKPESLIEFVQDRPGHDFRYSLNADKIAADTGWKPSVTFEQGIERTVRWYVDNQDWWRKF